MCPLARPSLALLLLAPLAAAQDAPPEIRLAEALVIPPVGSWTRSALHVDFLEARIVDGSFEPPKAGDAIPVPGGPPRTWDAARADESGRLAHESLRGGYAHWTVEAAEEGTWMLHASGHTMVYVDGVPRTGDPYASGTVALPVRLHAGPNRFLFRCARGELTARIVRAEPRIRFAGVDPTLPDLLVGSAEAVLAAIVVVNAEDRARDDLAIVATLGGTSLRSKAGPVLPLSIRKIGFRIPGAPPAEPGEVEVELALEAGGEIADRTTVKVRAVRPGELHRRTFLSGIDGSVQYYAVLPARPLAGDSERPALVLSLHGAGVDAFGQAGSYAPKPWAHVVAPTNRRPFGFDWEDWGRLDALEVLEDASRVLETDPARVYLTGHSMGGHGTWHVAAMHPDRFAAIGPSAGWISFSTYGGAKAVEGGPVLEILARAASTSETLALLPNYARQGIYVLHGAADDNVPVTEARRMAELLGSFHRDWVLFEQPGAGHWWDASDEAGTDCVDWAPMFDLFARRRLPAAVREIDFVTVNPAASASRHWIRVEAQDRALAPTRVRLRLDPGVRRLSGSTENATRLSFDLAALPWGGPIRFAIDGADLETPWPEGSERLWLERKPEGWQAVGRPPLSEKGAHRGGPFRQVFGRRVTLVYGTRGDGGENAWALARARYDAETFWYRGNGSFDVVPDTAFDPAADPDRHVVLYGNAATNSAWAVLLGESPIQVDRERVAIGDREFRGSDLACLVLRPRPGSDLALVGAVAGTGRAGSRLTDRLPYFVSGVAYPDFVVMDGSVLAGEATGVRAAGYFGRDWGLGSGETAWSPGR